MASSLFRPSSVTTLPARVSLRLVLLVGAVFALGAALLVHAVGLFRPMLVYDDFQILAASWTWQRTSENLWMPANEHTMPLGRLSTYVLVQLAGGPTGLPLLTAL